MHHTATVLYFQVHQIVFSELQHAAAHCKCVLRDYRVGIAHHYSNQTEQRIATYCSILQHTGSVTAPE